MSAHPAVDPRPRKCREIDLVSEGVTNIKLNLGKQTVLVKCTATDKVRETSSLASVTFFSEHDIVFDEEMIKDLYAGTIFEILCAYHMPTASAPEHVLLRVHAFKAHVPISPRTSADVTFCAQTTVRPAKHQITVKATLQQ